MFIFAEHEIERQIELLEAGKQVMQETRGFDTRLGTTFLLRSKEESRDYRCDSIPEIRARVCSVVLIHVFADICPNLIFPT